MKVMELGIVTRFDAKAGTGHLTALDGQEYVFKFGRGQNMMLLHGTLLPQFTGRHSQPGRFALKEPVEGDAVIVQTSEHSDIVVWGYVHHFLDIIERRYGSTFSPVDRQSASVRRVA